MRYLLIISIFIIFLNHAFAEKLDGFTGNFKFVSGEDCAFPIKAEISVTDCLTLEGSLSFDQTMTEQMHPFFNANYFCPGERKELVGDYVHKTSVSMSKNSIVSEYTLEEKSKLVTHTIEKWTVSGDLAVFEYKIIKKSQDSIIHPQNLLCVYERE